MVLAVVLALASVVAPAVHTEALATACTRTHIAKPNDSWSRLAARFGTSQKELLSLNGATSDTALFVGDKVCISTQPIVAPSAEQLSRKKVIAIIREVWPDELEETALFVAKRESNYIHTVVGGRNDCCLGLFQIYWSVHQLWLTEVGITAPSQLLNARTNAEVALALYRRNGNSWRPWWTSSWRQP